jgi:hypothetical protein
MLEYAFQKRDDIDILKSSCIQNINLLLENYHFWVSEMRRFKIEEKACLELDHLISMYLLDKLLNFRYPESFMNQLKNQLKLVELQAQMDELEKRPTSDHVLMGEKDGEDSGLEVKFQISSNISALLKEIKALVIDKASFTITLPLHEKLSQKSIQISHAILNRINLVIIYFKVILDPKHVTELFY